MQLAKLVKNFTEMEYAYQFNQSKMSSPREELTCKIAHMTDRQASCDHISLNHIEINITEHQQVDCCFCSNIVMF